MFKTIVLVALVSMRFAATAHHDLGSFVGGTQGTGTGIISLKPGSWLLENNISYINYRAFARGEIDAIIRSGDRILDASNLWQNSIGLHYAAHKRLIITARIPLLLATMHEYSMPQVYLLDSIKTTRGIADMALMANWQIVNNWNGYYIAISTGLELPTGKSFALETSNLFVTGSGSYDPIFGLTFTKRSEKLNIQANANHKFCRTNLNEYLQGSSSMAEILFFYNHSLAFNKLDKGNSQKSKTKKVAFQSIIGLRWQQQEPAFLALDQLPNTGYNHLGLKLGFRLLIKKQIFIPFTLYKPMLQNVTGFQNKQNLMLSTGISILFSRFN